MSTITELVAQVRVKTEINLAEDLSDASIIQSLNEAYVEIWNSSPRWSFRMVVEDVTLDEDESSFALTTPRIRGVDTVVFVEDGQDYQLRPRGDYPTNWNDDKDLPLEYWLDGSTLRVWPTPSREVTLKVRLNTGPATLTGSDTPVFPAEYHSAIMYLAASSILEDQGDKSPRIGGFAARASSTVAKMNENDSGIVVRPFNIGSSKYTNTPNKRRRPFITSRLR